MSSETNSECQAPHSLPCQRYAGPPMLAYRGGNQKKTSTNLGEAMSGLFWFVAGFLSCVAISVLSVSLVVWRTPPAPEELENTQSAQPSGETNLQHRSSPLSQSRQRAAGRFRR
jgi:hypothetical protein